jgi:hypothetical protein
LKLENYRPRYEAWRYPHKRPILEGLWLKFSHAAIANPACITDETFLKSSVARVMELAQRVKDTKTPLTISDLTDAVDRGLEMPRLICAKNLLRFRERLNGLVLIESLKQRALRPKRTSVFA